MGKTHCKIGVLYYILLGMLPFLTVPYFTDYKISLAGVGAAALGALLPDADTQHSKFNYINPVVGVPYRIVEKIERMLLIIIRFLLTIGIGLLVLYYSNYIILYLSLIPELSPWKMYITYGSAIILLIAGLGSGRLVKYIPFIGYIYCLFLKIIYKTGNFFKRVIMILIYISLGIGLIVYNYLQLQDCYVYLIGGLFICIAIFPHRTFLHSVEGLILFNISVSYIAVKVGFPYLATAFFIGYFSHLYLADVFTKEGIPLSILPFILKRLKLNGYLYKYKIYKLFYKVLNIRLRIPVVHTGTRHGTLIETLYIGCMLLIVGLILIKSGVLFSGM